MSLADMLRYLKAHMDPELDKMVVMLVKKAGETAGFIADEAKKTMIAAIDNCSEHRTISALLHPTPYTLHPAPCTLHPAPYTIHPAPSNYCTEMCSGSEAGSYLRLIDF